MCQRESCRSLSKRCLVLWWGRRRGWSVSRSEPVSLLLGQAAHQRSDKIILGRSSCRQWAAFSHMHHKTRRTTSGRRGPGNERSECRAVNRFERAWVAKGEGEGERLERVAVAVEGTGEGRADGLIDRNPEESHVGPRGEGGGEAGAPLRTPVNGTGKWISAFDGMDRVPRGCTHKSHTSFLAPLARNGKAGADEAPKLAGASTEPASLSAPFLAVTALCCAILAIPRLGRTKLGCSLSHFQNESGHSKPFQRTGLARLRAGGAAQICVFCFLLATSSGPEFPFRVFEPPSPNASRLGRVWLSFAPGCGKCWTANTPYRPKHLRPVCTRHSNTTSSSGPAVRAPGWSAGCPPSRSMPVRAQAGSGR